MLHRILLLTLLSVQALCAQSALIGRGEHALGVGGAFLSGPASGSVGGSVSFALLGRVDIGYTYSHHTYTSSISGTGSALGISVLLTRGDLKPVRMYLALNYGYQIVTQRSAVRWGGLFGTQRSGSYEQEFISHALGLTFGNLPSTERRFSPLISVGVSQIFPKGGFDGSPVDRVAYDLTLGLRMLFTERSAIVPSATVARASSMTFLGVGVDFIFVVS